MKLKELEKFESKQNERLSVIRKEISNECTRLAEIEKKLEAAILNADQAAYRALVDEKSELTRDIEVKSEFVEKAAAKENPFFTENDVAEGWAEVEKVYKRKIADNTAKIEKLIEEAHEVYATMVADYTEAERSFGLFTKFLRNPKNEIAFVGSLRRPQRAYAFNVLVQKAMQKYL